MAVAHFRAEWIPWGYPPDTPPSVVIWRALTWKEYKHFQMMFDPNCPMDTYLQVFKTVVVACPWEKPDLIPAGIVEQVARQQLDDNPFSGTFKTIASALTYKRMQLYGSYLELARAVVAGTFRMPFEQLDEMDPDTFFMRLAQAEFINGSPLDPANPEEEKDPKKKQPRPKRALTMAQQMAKERVAEARAAEQGVRPGQQSNVPGDGPNVETFDFRR